MNGANRGAGVESMGYGVDKAMDRAYGLDVPPGGLDVRDALHML